MSAVLRRRSCASVSRSGCRALASWRNRVRSCVSASACCNWAWVCSAPGFCRALRALALAWRRACSSSCDARSRAMPARNSASIDASSPAPASGSPSTCSSRSRRASAAACFFCASVCGLCWSCSVAMALSPSSAGVCASRHRAAVAVSCCRRLRVLPRRHSASHRASSRMRSRWRCCKGATQRCSSTRCDWSSASSSSSCALSLSTRVSCRLKARAAADSGCSSGGSARKAAAGGGGGPGAGPAGLDYIACHMAKDKTQYTCNECGGSSPKWLGKCPHCNAWNTLIESVAESTAPAKNRFASLAKTAEVATLADIDATDVQRTPTGHDELDRVLGGGIVEGGVVLIGGDPGIGKSTLLLQALDSLQRSGQKTLYVTGEESGAQVALRSRRLGLDGSQVSVLAEIQLEKILATLDHTKPAIAVIDSIQTVYSEQLTSAPGSVAQVRECAAHLTTAAN